MAYFGKVFKFVKDENYEAFVAALVKEEDLAKLFLAWRPSQKLEKVGNSYKLTLITPDTTKEISFTPGENFDEEVGGGVVTKNVVTVDGDTFVQIQDFGEEKGTITTKREFSADELKETVVASKWDGGVVYRWFSAA